VALSPSIPTSFVPKQPVSPGKKRYSGTGNIFFLVGVFIGGLALVASGGVFLYENYLQGLEKTKGAELSAAENNVSPSTVEQFVRLRNRLSAAQTLIQHHVELSQFFNLLESITLQNVHFTNLTVTVANDGSATIAMTGVAKTFNALAAESTSFAGQPNIQSAIFSGISVNANGTVAFTLNATLAPALVFESKAPAQSAILSGSQTQATTTPSFTSTPPAASSTTKAATASTSTP
jgi:hypothetical protein